MWTFIQEQILGMKWLNVLIGNLLNILGLDTTEKIGGTVQFFIYDVIKIVVLLCTLIFIINIKKKLLLNTVLVTLSTMATPRRYIACKQIIAMKIRCSMLSFYHSIESILHKTWVFLILSL